MNTRILTEADPEADTLLPAISAFHRFRRPWHTRQWPIALEDWTRALLPYTFTRSEVRPKWTHDSSPVPDGITHLWQPLFRAIREFGEDELIVRTDCKMEDRSFVSEGWPGRYALITSDLVSVNSYLFDLNLSTGQDIFSKSMKWCVVDTGYEDEDDFVAVSGTPEFMECYFSQWGGEDNAQRVQYFFDLHSVPDRYPNLDAWQHFIRPDYENAGWPVPRHMPHPEMPLDWDWVLGKSNYPKIPPNWDQSKDENGIRDIDLYPFEKWKKMYGLD